MTDGPQDELGGPLGLLPRNISTAAQSRALGVWFHRALKIHCVLAENLASMAIDSDSPR